LKDIKRMEIVPVHAAAVPFESVESGLYGRV
jgi:hypothetical protein